MLVVFFENLEHKVSGGSKAIRYTTRSNGQAKYKEKVDKFLKQLSAEVLNKQTRSYFFRTIKYDGQRMERDSFIHGVEGGCRLQAVGPAKWNNFNVYTPPLPGPPSMPGLPSLPGPPGMP